VIRAMNLEDEVQRLRFARRRRKLMGIIEK
jgi:hypothetical protein